MNGVGIATSVEILVMIGVPIALAVTLARRAHASWATLGAGVVSFLGSQVVHLPLNWGLASAGVLGAARPAVMSAIVLGLTSGLCEESARWLTLRFWRRGDRDAPSALMFGTGHGGVESVFVGLIAAATLASMFAMRDVDPRTIGVPAEQAGLVGQQVAAFWALPWWSPLLGAAERLMAITFHLSASSLVVLALVRRQPAWVALAVLWHAVTNTSVVLALGAWGPVAAEGLLLAMTPVSVALILGVRRSLARSVAPPPSPPVGPASATDG